MAYVAVDDHHLLFLDGQSDGRVDGNEGFSRARVERGEHEDVGLFVLAHKLQISAEHAECLVDDIAAAFLHHNTACKTFLLLLVFLLLDFLLGFLLLFLLVGLTIGKRYLAH